MIWPTRSAVAAIALLALAGCGGDTVEIEPETGAGTADAAKAEEQHHVRVSEAGPVTATVTLTPREPRLGDSLVLTLKVESDAGVTVEMPAFGEALGRFSIVDYTPRAETTADGGRVEEQRYTLQAPMSGRQRIPPLRLEFVDQRDGQGDGEVRELLTEEIALTVESVLPDGEVSGELKPARGELEPQVPAAARSWAAWVGGLLAAAAAIVGLLWWRQYAHRQRRISAYDKAMARLRKLEGRGLPDASAADAWYVELSATVRRYLEDRYGVRAPELTTEEFLREARRSHELTASHRELLSSFLEICDRVKFAAYVPDDKESTGALAAARRFLDETRLRPEEEKRKERAAAAA